MEVFDLYDGDFNLLDHKIERGNPTQKGEYHLVVHIWIKNSEGQYLIQQRNKLTDEIPFQWAATGGAVTSGENSIEGAIRETQEELGIQLQPRDLKLVNRYFVDEGATNFITDLYLVEKDILIKDTVLDTVEVKQVKYFTIDEIYDLIKQKKHWNYTRYQSRSSYFKDLEKS